MCGVVCVCVCLYVRSAPSAGSTIGGEAVAKQLCPCGWQMDEANSDDNAIDATLLYDTKVRSGEYCAVLCFCWFDHSNSSSSSSGDIMGLRLITSPCLCNRTLIRQNYANTEQEQKGYSQMNMHIIVVCFGTACSLMVVLWSFPFVLHFASEQ